MKERLRFTLDSALLREVGEKLVETVHLAIAELIKNAYDADSSMALVQFKKDEKGNEEIHKTDDEVGMNFQEVEKYWMRIAATNKSEYNISRKLCVVMLEMWKLVHLFFTSNMPVSFHLNYRK
jgi:predicted urease superfamily metal-dependent hydrolase